MKLKLKYILTALIVSAVICNNNYMSANAGFLWRFKSVGNSIYNNTRNIVECNIGVTVSDD